MEIERFCRLTYIQTREAIKARVLATRRTVADTATPPLHRCPTYPSPGLYISLSGPRRPLASSPPLCTPLPSRVLFCAPFGTPHCRGSFMAQCCSAQLVLQRLLGAGAGTDTADAPRLDAATIATLHRASAFCEVRPPSMFSLYLLSLYQLPLP